MRNNILILFLSLLLVAPLIRAEESPPCSVATPQDILDCALENHPDVLRSEIQIKNIGAYDTLARQRPNPELETEAASQSGDDNPSFKGQATYLHRFELGSKRKKRIGQSEARKNLILAQASAAKEEVALKTVVNLHRLRQISSELQIVAEALGTFDTIIQQYKSRQALSPEQNVSLNVFLLAQGDYVLKKSALIQEKETLRSFFEIATGAPIEKIMSALPAKKQTWPVIEDSFTRSAMKGARFRELEAQSSLSKSEIEVAKSEASSDLQFGPMVEIENGRGQDSESFGAALNVPLPFNKNKGGIALAKAEADLTEANAQLLRKELSAEIAVLVRNYNEAINALKNTPSVPQMETKHKNMEELFERGLVSASLIIEAHRQMAEFAKDQNEQELNAVEALWSLYALQGRALEEKL